MIVLFCRFYIFLSFRTQPCTSPKETIAQDLLFPSSKNYSVWTTQLLWRSNAKVQDLKMEIPRRWVPVWIHIDAECFESNGIYTYMYIITHAYTYTYTNIYEHIHKHRHMHVAAIHRVFKYVGCKMFIAPDSMRPSRNIEEVSGRQSGWWQNKYVSDLSEFNSVYTYTYKYMYIFMNNVYANTTCIRNVHVIIMRTFQSIRTSTKDSLVTADVFDVFASL